MNPNLNHSEVDKSESEKTSSHQEIKESDKVKKQEFKVPKHKISYRAHMRPRPNPDNTLVTNTKESQVISKITEIVAKLTSKQVRNCN